MVKFRSGHGLGSTGTSLVYGAEPAPHEVDYSLLEHTYEIAQKTEITIKITCIVSARDSLPHLIYWSHMKCLMTIVLKLFVIVTNQF